MEEINERTQTKYKTENINGPLERVWKNTE